MRPEGLHVAVLTFGPGASCVGAFFNTPIDPRSHSVPHAGMVTHKNNSLSDLIRNGYWLKLTCQCGHEARVDPLTLRTQLFGLGKSMQLDRLSDAVKCKECGGRTFDAEACFAPEAWS